jgi:hypothetical protein
VSLRVVNVTWMDLDPLAFIHFFNQFWNVARFVCLLYTADLPTLPESVSGE